MDYRCTDSMHPVMLTGSQLYASTVTLTEVSDGSARDARVRRVLRALDSVIPPSETIAFDAGRLRAAAATSRRKPRDLTVDAIVAATALTLRPPVIVLTAGKPDLDLLLDGTGVDVRSVG
jgi:predicted nucleic acid-binding protein